MTTRGSGTRSHSIGWTNWEIIADFELLSNRAAVPALMWVVLLATGITTIGFSFFFGTQNSSAQALMTAALSATIALVLFLIWALNHPFAGLVRVEPAAFHQLWSIIDQWAAQQ